MGMVRWADRGGWSLPHPAALLHAGAGFRLQMQPLNCVSLDLENARRMQVPEMTGRTGAGRQTDNLMVILKISLPPPSSSERFSHPSSLERYWGYNMYNYVYYVYTRRTNPPGPPRKTMNVLFFCRNVSRLRMYFCNPSQYSPYGYIT